VYLSMMLVVVVTHPSSGLESGGAPGGWESVQDFLPQLLPNRKRRLESDR
jgi:hypothetical protein